MNKKTKKGIVFGLILAAFAAILLTSKKAGHKLSGKYKNDQSKLDAIREILGESRDQSEDKVASLKDWLNDRKNDISK